MNRTVLVIGIIFLLMGVSVVSSTNNISKVSSVNKPNNPPYPPSTPNPCNGTTNLSICPLNLSWIGGDPDPGDTVLFDIYFGSTNPPPLVASNVSEYTTGILGFNKTYYWKIVAWDDHGASTHGPIWHFTTEQNYPPNPAENPYPPDDDCCVPVEGVILKWNGSDPNLCDMLLYDLYFDDVNPPLTQQLWESSDDFWVIDVPLTKYDTYYWRVDTYDKSDEFTPGKVWSFTCGDNTPPTDPIIDGPPIGGVNKEYEFTFVSTDAEDHDIQYRVRWNDGTEETTDLLPNGTIATLSHVWKNEKEYTIQARAIDEHGAFSDWSTHTITIPRNKVFNLKLLDMLFARFPNAFPILRQLLGL